jgi:plastocyanin
MSHNASLRSSRSRFSILLVVVFALGLSLAACSSSSKSGSGGSSGSGSAVITMQNTSFKVAGPVKAGATVNIKNNDSFQHTVTSDDGTSFNVSVDGGKTATITAPSKAGTYKFHCNIHSNMHATLTVQ